ncbi:hypothetical protein EDC04DRAFT_2601421 [Pisolithus marmoratus]|nr:hypothetical protein EDC04DRAFT_2601421 [Pisolithus marmoratus]
MTLRLNQTNRAKCQKSKEQAAAEWAEKAAANKKKINKWLDNVAGLASMEMYMQEESQNVMSQAARPPPSQVQRKVPHNVSISMEPLSQVTPANQLDCMSAPSNCNGLTWRKAIAPKLKLWDEVRSAQSVLMWERKDLGGMRQHAKCKAAADLDNARQNKRTKPYKPFGLTLSSEHHPLRDSQSPDEVIEPISTALHQSQTPSAGSIISHLHTHSHTPSITQLNSAPTSKPPSCVSRPPSCQHIVSGTSMPVEDYGGFYDEDETAKQESLLCTISSTDEEDKKFVIPCAIGKFNAMLPHEISPQFQDVFIPTLLAYCSTVPNPWLIPLQDAFSALWPVMFPQVPYDEQVYRTGTSTFLVTADKVVATWFDSDEFLDSEDCAAWAEWAVDASLGFPFVFKYLKSNNVDNYPYGALMLSMVGVEHAISMYTESGCHTKESKAAAGNFSGDLHGKQGLSNEDTSISSSNAESDPIAESQPRPWNQWAANDNVLSAESQPIVAHSQPRPWDQWAVNDSVLSAATVAVHAPTFATTDDSESQPVSNVDILA